MTAHYRSSLDKTVDQLRMSLFSLRAAYSASEHQAQCLPEEAVQLKKEAAQMLEYLEAHIKRCDAVAQQSRSTLAQDRAWYLLALYEAGALDKMAAFEMVDHLSPLLQKDYSYPEDLREKLSNPDLHTAVFEMTGYAWYH